MDTGNRFFASIDTIIGRYLPVSYFCSSALMIFCKILANKIEQVDTRNNVSALIWLRAEFPKVLVSLQFKYVQGSEDPRYFVDSSRATPNDCIRACIDTQKSRAFKIIWGFSPQLVRTILKNAYPAAHLDSLRNSDRHLSFDIVSFKYLIY